MNNKTLLVLIALLIDANTQIVINIMNLQTKLASKY